VTAPFVGRKTLVLSDRKCGAHEQTLRLVALGEVDCLLSVLTVMNPKSNRLVAIVHAVMLVALGPWIHSGLFPLRI